MGTQEIADKLEIGFKADAQVYPALLVTVKDTVLRTIQANASVFAEIQDEAQFFDVVALLITCYIPKSTREGRGFVEKLLFSLIGSQIEQRAIRYMLTLLDRQLLDRIFGPAWFTVLKSEAQKAAQ